jgi:hypothetical protein
VAVIILDRPFDLSPVQVWSSEGPERCDEVAIPGFGLQRRVPSPLQSSDGRLRVIPNARVHSEQLCMYVFCFGGESPAKICAGDSGAPVFARLPDKTFTLVGVADEREFYCKNDLALRPSAGLSNHSLWKRCQHNLCRSG